MAVTKIQSIKYSPEKPHTHEKRKFEFILYFQVFVPEEINLPCFII